MKMIKVDDIIEYCDTERAMLHAHGESTACAALRRLSEYAKDNAVEAEPAVRCKDCKYRQDGDFCGGRGWPAQLVPDDGYCDRGARMDGDNNG